MPSAEDELHKRFYILNACVTILLLAAIFISISQFGAQTWRGSQQIGFIIPGSKNDMGWNRVQYQGIFEACKELNYDLILEENVPVDNNDKVVEKLSQKGVRIIFFANSCPIDRIEEFSKKYPNIRFYVIESTFALSTISKYSIDYINLRYISGVLAGLHTKTNKIGYIAPFKTAPIMQGINAFTLGVQRVNPEAQVILTWTGSLDNPQTEEQAVRNLKAEHVDTISYFQHGKTVPDASESAEVDFIAFHESYEDHNHCLASIETDWKTAYLDILRLYQRQTYNSYFEDRGLAEIKFNKEKLTSRECVILDTTKYQLNNGRQVFKGEIFDRDGNLRCSDKEIIGNQYLQNNMDWLVKGVTTIGK